MYCLIGRTPGHVFGIITQCTSEWQYYDNLDNNDVFFSQAEMTDKLKKRAERFGTVTSTTLTKVSGLYMKNFQCALYRLTVYLAVILLGKCVLKIASE